LVVIRNIDHEYVWLTTCLETCQKVTIYLDTSIDKGCMWTVPISLLYQFEETSAQFLKLHLLMSLPAMTSGDKFSFRRKCRIGGSGWCTQRVQTAWSSLTSALKMPWLTLSGPLLFSYAQWVEKTVLSPCMAVGKPLSQSGRALAG